MFSCKLGTKGGDSLPEKKLCTAQEIAEVLDLSVDTVWRYTREKRIPHIEVGPRQYRYVKEDVLATLNGREGSFQVQEEKAGYGASEKLIYEDYTKLPHVTGSTTELIDGMAIRQPGPSVRHQRVSRRLMQILISYFGEIDPQGEVFSAPLAVFLGEYTVVQPDIFYLPGSRPARTTPVDALPELVIEIISPATSKTDRIRKSASYLQAGIPHYWIVDPDHDFMHCHALRNGHYAVLLAIDEGAFDHPDFPGLTFAVEELFARS